MTMLAKVTTLLGLGKPMTISEIADQFGAPRSTVSSMLYANKDKFANATVADGPLLWELTEAALSVTGTVEATPATPADPAEIVEKDRTIISLKTQLAATRRLYRRRRGRDKGHACRGPGAAQGARV